jgi:hypothetical protein
VVSSADVNNKLLIPYGNGAGVLVHDASALELAHLQLLNCSTQVGHGGGIAVVEFAAIVLDDVRIHNCSAALRGGGISIFGLDSRIDASALSITRCSVHGHVSQQSFEIPCGGALAVVNTALSISSGHASNFYKLYIANASVWSPNDVDDGTFHGGVATCVDSSWWCGDLCGLSKSFNSDEVEFEKVKSRMDAAPATWMLSSREALPLWSCASSWTFCALLFHRNRGKRMTHAIGSQFCSEAKLANLSNACENATPMCLN